MGGLDIEILMVLANSTELTAKHVGRLLGNRSSAHELEGQLFELEREGMVELDDLNAVPVVVPGSPTPVTTRYWKITGAGRELLASQRS